MLRVSLVAAVFIAWFAVSVANQFRSGALTARLRRHIPLGLIPLWTFFAPNPARADSRVIWRAEIDGRWHQWQEVHHGFGSWRTRWLVHPQLISNKAVADLVNSLLRTDASVAASDTSDRSIVLSSSYVTLLSIVADRSRHTPCAAVQFAIVRTSKMCGRRAVELAFVSEVHDVSEPNDDPDVALIPEPACHVR